MTTHPELPSCEKCGQTVPHGGVIVTNQRARAFDPWGPSPATFHGGCAPWDRLRAWHRDADGRPVRPMTPEDLARFAPGYPA